MSSTPQVWTDGTEKWHLCFQSTGFPYLIIIWSKSKNTYRNSSEGYKKLIPTPNTYRYDLAFEWDVYSSICFDLQWNLLSADTLFEWRKCPLNRDVLLLMVTGSLVIGRNFFSPLATACSQNRGVPSSKLRISKIKKVKKASFSDSEL